MRLGSLRVGLINIFHISLLEYCKEVEGFWERKVRFNKKFMRSFPDVRKKPIGFCEMYVKKHLCDTFLGHGNIACSTSKLFISIL